MKGQKLSYAIIGTGALGGYYGIKLAAVGKEVHFLLRSDFDHVKTRGLKLESHDQIIHLHPVKACGSPEQMVPCDIVCICLKTTENKILSQILPHVIKPGGAILVMQNGLGIEEEIAGKYPDYEVLGGLCYLCSHKEGPGFIRHLDYGLLSIGALGKPDSSRREILLQDFKDAGIPVNWATDLREARWKKLLWNIPFNGLTVVFNATTKEIMADPQGRKLSRAIMQDIIEGASACGVNIDEAFADRMIVFTQKMTPYRPSMKVDYDEHRPMEIEYLYEKPIEATEKAGKRMPFVSMLCHQLRFLEGQQGDKKNR